MRTTLWIGGAVLAAAAIGLWSYVQWSRGGALKLPAVVEIQEVRLGSKVGGRVARLLVEEGKKVKPGDEVVIFEAPELENQVRQWQAKLDAAEAELRRALNGPRKEEIDAARAAADAAKALFDRSRDGWREEEKRLTASELETAAAEFKQANLELARVEELFQVRSVSKGEYDVARGSRDRALGRFNAAKAKLDMYKEGSRKEDINQAKAMWDQAQAKYHELKAGTREEDKALAKARRDEVAARLDEARINLAEATVRVPSLPSFYNAVVEVVPIRPGDLVAANQPVVRLVCTNDLWIKTFVPETKLGHIHIDQKVEVRIDTFPHRIFQGKVYYIAPSSEFTPRNVQSVDERRYQVFAVKVLVEDSQEVFHAGMAAEVTIPLDGGRE